MGRSIQNEGIVPDILLKEAGDPEERDDPATTGEAALQNRLDNPEGGSEEPRTPASVIILPKPREGDTTDHALDEALKLLKGMVYTRRAAG